MRRRRTAAMSSFSLELKFRQNISPELSSFGSKARSLSSRLTEALRRRQPPLPNILKQRFRNSRTISINSKLMESSLHEVWESAVGNPFVPTIGKNSQFFVGISLLVIGVLLSGLFGLSMCNFLSIGSSLT
jgi:hypothetical protein